MAAYMAAFWAICKGPKQAFIFRAFVSSYCHVEKLFGTRIRVDRIVKKLWRNLKTQRAQHIQIFNSSVKVPSEKCMYEPDANPFSSKGLLH